MTMARQTRTSCLCLFPALGLSPGPALCLWEPQTERSTWKRLIGKQKPLQKKERQAKQSRKIPTTEKITVWTQSKQSHEPRRCFPSLLKEKKVDDSNPTPSESTNFYFFCAITNKKNNPVLKTFIFRVKALKKISGWKVGTFRNRKSKVQEVSASLQTLCTFCFILLGSMFICESEYSLLLMTALIDDKGPWLHREDKKETMSHFISPLLPHLLSLSPCFPVTNIARSSQSVQVQVALLELHT